MSIVGSSECNGNRETVRNVGAQGLRPEFSNNNNEKSVMYQIIDNGALRCR